MLFRILQIAIPFVWFGAVAAISFMEAPLKFQAPNITLPLGLGIGRLVFQALNIAEIVMALVLALSIFFAQPKDRTPIWFFNFTLVILILQTAWLLPALAQRSDIIISGGTPPQSDLHLFYIVFEVVKLVLLFILGAVMVKQNLAPQDDNAGY